MANYTNQTNVENFLGRALTAREASELSFLLPAIDTWINKYLETRFDSVASSTRYFDGGWHTIDIDPCQTITAVKSLNNDGSDSYSYTENTEIVYEPVNDTVKREIVYRSGMHFPRGQRRMAVTGLFTEYDYVNSKVPDDIVLAATRLLGGVINAGKTAGQGGNIQEEELEGHRVRYQITDLALKTLAFDDPIIAATLGARREVLIYDDKVDLGDDDW